MDYSSIKIPCILGPTAIGKTALALELAREFPIEIISVDSAMIYKGMDIGTAKPANEILQQIPHHLIDICDPAEPYSAARFCEDANQHINDILQRQHIPLLVGGTMMYFNALHYGLAELPSADKQTRMQLEHEIKTQGLAYLYKRLCAVDPIAAQRIHPNDRQRLQRAYEIYLVSGQSMTELIAQANKAFPQRQWFNIAMIPQERSALHTQIELRLTTMMRQGFIDEVRHLHQRHDLYLNLPSIRAVGYQQVWRYLEGEYDEATCYERILFATRQFAKRQLTWLKSWKSELINLKLDPSLSFAAQTNEFNQQLQTIRYVLSKFLNTII